MFQIWTLVIRLVGSLLLPSEWAIFLAPNIATLYTKFIHVYSRGYFVTIEKCNKVDNYLPTQPSFFLPILFFLNLHGALKGKWKKHLQACIFSFILTANWEDILETGDLRYYARWKKVNASQRLSAGEEALEGPVLLWWASSLAAVSLMTEAHLLLSSGWRTAELTRKHSTDFLWVLVANFPLGGEITGTDKPILRD